jgi:hypothetical protein
VGVASAELFGMGLAGESGSTPHGARTPVGRIL